MLQNYFIYKKCAFISENHIILNKKSENFFIWKIFRSFYLFLLQQC